MRILNFLARLKSPPQAQGDSTLLSFGAVFQDRRLQVAGYILITLLHLLLISAPFIQRLELVFLDAFFRHRPPLMTSSKIVYVEIAQDSIDKIGRWPWPRRYHAALLSILNEWQTHAVVFDAFFSEPSPDQFDDSAFSESLAKTKNVYAGTVLEDAPLTKDGANSREDKIWVHSIPQIEKYLRGIGHVNISPDVDGITRHAQLEITQKNETHAYLGVEVAKDYLADTSSKNIQKKYPVDRRGMILINWADRWEKSFKHFSYWDVLQSYSAVKKGEKPVVTAEDLKGKIVLIGVTASGLTDIKGVPLQSVFPGVGVIANIMNSILTNQFIREASRQENTLMLLAVAIAMGFWFWNASKVLVWAGVFLAAAGWVGAAFLIFWKMHVFYQVVNPLLLIVTFFIFSIIIGFLRSQNEQSILYRLATRDGLTGLYTIRHMRSLLDLSVAHCSKSKRALSVVMTDVDFFKKVNDTHGHDAGDQILKDLARLIELNFNELNVAGGVIRAGRYGGEEFIVLVEGYTGLEVQARFAEPLRKRVEEFQFHYEGKKIPITISLGVAELWKEETSPDKVTKRADEALYRAKNSGRNRVEIG